MNTSSSLSISLSTATTTTTTTTMAMVPLTSAPLMKIALLLATGVSVHFSLTPPHKAVPKTVVVSNNRTLFERAVQWVTWCSKTMVCMMTLSDALATYLTAYHPSLPIPISTCPNPSFLSLSSSFLSSSSITTTTPPLPLSPLLTPTPLLILGSLSAILGNLLRQRCFKELGPLFTFEVTIQPDHKLITTGPYAYVRHPSYLGIYMTLLGPSVMAVARGSWIRECWLSLGCSKWSSSSGTGGMVGGGGGWWTYVPTLGQLVMFALLAFWTVKVLFALRSTNRRMVVEDQELHGVFGEVWEEYERRVPWKLVPWVY